MQAITVQRRPVDAVTNTDICGARHTTMSIVCTHTRTDGILPVVGVARVHKKKRTMCKTNKCMRFTHDVRAYHRQCLCVHGSVSGFKSTQQILPSASVPIPSAALLNLIRFLDFSSAALVFHPVHTDFKCFL